jgi:phosphate/sulfate permease
MSAEMIILVLLIATALALDFTNGFHDTGNAMATSIATGALKPKTAVLLAGVLNLVGAFLSVEVAVTVTTSVLKVQDSKSGHLLPGIDASTGLTIIFAGLIGGILWNFRWGQIATASLVALSHGTNDAQKTMGVIALALITTGHLTGDVKEDGLPFWIIFSCALAIGLGTYIGGWRVIRREGTQPGGDPSGRRSAGLRRVATGCGSLNHFTTGGPRLSAGGRSASGVAA